MKSISRIIILLFALVSCKKETADYIWEKSLSKGNACFAISSADSGILTCGTLNNQPYLLKLSREKEVVFDYTSGHSGLFSSAWSDDSCFVAAGNSNGKMLIECINHSGMISWDTTFAATFQVDITNLYYTGNGNFLALGSASADSTSAGATGFLFVKFDTTGKVTLRKENKETNFIAAGSMAVDNSGNIFLPLTRKASGAKSKASVAKYNSDFQRIWETELYNNPSFGAASVSIALDKNGIIYVTGKTEITKEQEVMDNSFIASVSVTGTIKWKNYLEMTNCGSALSFNDDMVIMLNKNCYIINMIDPDDGSETKKIRLFSLCNSINTSAFGYDLDVDYAGNLLVSGMRGGNFYLALKSSNK